MKAQTLAAFSDFAGHPIKKRRVWLENKRGFTTTIDFIKLHEAFLILNSKRSTTSHMEWKILTNKGVVGFINVWRDDELVFSV